jgi:hypothetical protein
MLRLRVKDVKDNSHVSIQEKKTGKIKKFGSSRKFVGKANMEIHENH